MTDSGPPMVEVFRDGKVHVRTERCDHCLLGSDRIVSGDRARDLVATTRASEGGSFICHKSQISDEPEAICRGWWDAFADEDWVLRLAKAMDIVEYVEPLT